MEILTCERPKRIIINRKKLEEKLGIKITGKGNEITIRGSAENEYTAKKVIDALEFGFPFSVALLIKEQDFMFEAMNIKDHTKRKDLEKVRARIIGKQGKTLRALLELTKCHFEIKDNLVGIVGEPEYMRIATEAMMYLIHGAKHANVYSFLEKHQIKPVIDLGLKPVKKPKKKK